MATQKKAPLTTDKRNALDEGTFAFPKQRKEPLNNAAHVRNAIARFDQVKDVSEADKKAAFKRIQTAAKKFNVDMTATNEPQLAAKSPAKKKAPAKASTKTAAKKTAKKAAKKTTKKATK